MGPEQPPDDKGTPRGYKPRLLMVLITLLLILALLVTLIWPLLQSGPRQSPTPAPGILREA